MIAQRRGDCSECTSRIRPGDRVIAADGVWQHAKCPPPRVVFVCECGRPCPCDCDAEEVARG